MRRNAVPYVGGYKKSMALKLMYITNHTGIAQILDGYGVDRIFLDLEIIGKEKIGNKDFAQEFKESFENQCFEKLYEIMSDADFKIRLAQVQKNSIINRMKSKIKK